LNDPGKAEPIMSEPSLIEREVQVLQDLEKQAAERAAGEARYTGELAARTEAIESEYRTARRTLEQKIAQALKGIQATGENERAALKAQGDADRIKLQKEYETATATAKQKQRSDVSKAKKAFEDTRWQANAVHESGRESVKKHNEQATRELAIDEKTRSDIDAEANGLLDRYKRLIDPNAAPAQLAESAIVAPPGSDTETPEGEAPVVTGPRAQLQESIRAIDAHIVALHKLASLKMIRIDTFAFLAIFLIGGLAAAGAFATPLGTMVGGIVGGVVGLALAVGLRLWLATMAKKGVTRIGVPLKAELERAARLSEEAKNWIAEDFRKKKEDVEIRRDNELKKGEELLAQRTAAAESRMLTETKRVEEIFPPQVATQAKTHEEQVRAAEEKLAKKLADTRTAGEEALRKLDDSHTTRAKAHAEAVVQHWETLSKNWTEGSARIMAEVQSIHEEDDRLYPKWEAGWHGWKPPVDCPALMRFGEFEVFPASLPNGTPDDERLVATAPSDFTLPAMLDLRRKASVVFRVGEEGRDEAVDWLQAIMLRMFTSIPPSRVRFTIVDPVGLGRNFSSFMHLSEIDEQIISTRIWTDSAQIETRLKDLTEHMENVILAYLRNDYPTIEEYNAQAGEVAEPYRVLVIANFPHGFTEPALKSLMNIVSSGSRVGVHTLISVDTRAPMPFGFTLKDLEAQSNSLIWKDGKFLWREPQFEQFRLLADKPPAAEDMTEMLQELGKKSKEARKVEVPFEVIAPRDNDWWTTDSRSGIDVPLGRAGATKFQNIKLGKGTSQHVLIAGKTGSGKSTLLHALITNVALRYSPKEVELYLIDFKKGVEFKTYASHALPHARVIAVESEREFGLSVLQRLDSELKTRGEKYRLAGAQDVASYRAARPDEDLPRMLLLVDEFQEFFVEDDKLAQEASLLLDRLVRQGRAFGIHVHLGSQSLGGAYGLARTTLAQMAIRIALQCSESDSHLILSEDNSAARLLSRPGEAIYNDSNGMVEGNHVFQIVWLSDSRRERYLIDLKKMAEDRGLVPVGKQIVFEGNSKAELTSNPPLNELLDLPGWPDLSRTIPAWLGEAIAIKPPTEAPFQPQSGSHLLLVGQQSEAAIGVLTSAIFALAVHHEPHTARGARFILFDGTPSDAPDFGKLTRLADILPHPFEVGSVRKVTEIITDLANEVESRLTDEPSEMPAIYLIVHDLTRFRDLRKSEDDFGSFGSFGGGEKVIPASKQFVTILREGPAVNVHVLCWCDTVSNLNRTFDRQGMGEFEMRVLFQMSAADSSQLIDTPAAGRLGENRALFYSEEQGRLEKFRPYNPPTDEELAEFRRRFFAKPIPPAPPEQPKPVKRPPPVDDLDDYMSKPSSAESRDDPTNGIDDYGRPADDEHIPQPWETTP
jgi:S-DNA-T family DNA segregation ATPase FtsK/SpoIIIE